MARYKGGAKARSGYDITSSELPFYDINARLEKAEKYSTKMLRSEYTRMRDIAQKRLKRLAGTDEGKFVAQQHPDGFPKISQMGKAVDPFTGKKDVSRRELAKALKEVSNFLTASRSSISGVRRVIKETVETIEENTTVRNKQGKVIEPGIKIPKEQLANYGRFINKLKKELGLDPYKYEAKYIAAAWSDLHNKGKITKKELEKAVLGVMADLKKLDDPVDDRKKAERIAHKVDKYFDIDKLDKRTVSGIQRRGKKRKK